MGRGFSKYKIWVVHNTMNKRVRYTMGKGFDISWVGEGLNSHRERSGHTTARWFYVQRDVGSKYHGKRVRYTLYRGFNIPRIRSWIHHEQLVQNTMLGGQEYNGMGFDIPLVDVRKTMGWGSIYHR